MLEVKKGRKKKAKKVAHVPLPDTIHNQYKVKADEANLSFTSYLSLVLIQNIRTPLKLEGGLRHVG